MLFGNGANCQAFLSLNTHVASTPRGVSGCASTVGLHGGLTSFPRTSFRSTLAGPQVSHSLGSMHRTDHSPLGCAMGVWVCGGVSGGHINPAVTSQLAGHRSRSDLMPGHHCFSYLSRIPLEESSDLHSRTNDGGCMRRSHRICGQLPCHQRRGRWCLSQDHRQDGRPICILPCASYIMTRHEIKD